MKDIVITAGTAIGSVLELAQNIKKDVDCNVFVLCTDFRTSHIFKSSKYIDDVQHIGAKDELEYLESIKKWYQQKTFTGKPILYFTTDTSCYYIDNEREWFEERFEMSLPSSEIIKTYTQKGLAEVSALEAGLTVPKTQIVDTKEDIDKVINSFSFPIILKPRATYLKANIGFKIKVINTKEEFLLETTNLIHQNNTLLCQEFIPGGNNTSFYYLFYRGSNGVINENIGRKTLQSTPNGGIMVKGLVEYNSELSKICRDFLNKIDYKGIGGIEFKKYNEKFYFIEMSTRLEGFYKIAEISNSPLSLLSYYDLSHNIKKRDALLNSKQNDGMMYMDFIPTLVTKVKSRKYISFIGDVFNAIFSPKTKLNVFSMSDPKPFFLTLKNLIVR
jgi:predicted ATP-grasp superfamily ATP-dependent carboligase